MRYLPILGLLLLAGCLADISTNDTSNCWRYGVAMDNTGPMSVTPLGEIPVVRLKYDELLTVCDGSPACYDPPTDTIYASSTVDINHEKCHILLGREHNDCYGTGYGIGSNELACNWGL